MPAKEEKLSPFHHEDRPFPYQLSVDEHWNDQRDVRSPPKKQKSRCECINSESQGSFLRRSVTVFIRRLPMTLFFSKITTQCFPRTHARSSQATSGERRRLMRLYGSDLKISFFFFFSRYSILIGFLSQREKQQIDRFCRSVAIRILFFSLQFVREISFSLSAFLSSAMIIGRKWKCNVLEKTWPENQTPINDMKPDAWGCAMENVKQDSLSPSSSLMIRERMRNILLSLSRHPLE